MKLYELTGSIAEILQDESIEDSYRYRKIEELSAERDTKIENCLKYLKVLEAQRDAIVSEVDRLKARKETTEKAIDNLKEYICICLFDGEKWNNGVFKVTKAISESVEIWDEAHLPDEYKVTKIEVKPNKKLIMEMLKNNIVVPECKIKRKEYLRIS